MGELVRTIQRHLQLALVFVHRADLKMEDQEENTRTGRIARAHLTSREFREDELNSLD